MTEKDFSVMKWKITQFVTQKNSTGI